MTSSRTHCARRAASPSLRVNRSSSGVSAPSSSRMRSAIGLRVSSECAERHGCVQILGRAAQLLDQLVAFGPGLDHLGDRRNMLEAAEQPDYVGNVVRVRAPLREPLEGDGVVEPLLLHLLPRPAITRRHPHQRAVVLVVGDIAGLRVAQQLKHRLLLRLGPETFSLRIAASRAQDAHALDRQPDEHDDDAEERPDDQQQSPADRDDFEDLADHLEAVRAVRSTFSSWNMSPARDRPTRRLLGRPRGVRYGLVFGQV